MLNHDSFGQISYRKCPWMDTIWWLAVASNFLNGGGWGILEGSPVVLAPFAERTAVLYQDALVPQTEIQFAWLTGSLTHPIVLSLILWSYTFTVLQCCPCPSLLYWFLWCLQSICQYQYLWNNLKSFLLAFIRSIDQIGGKLTSWQCWVFLCRRIEYLCMIYFFAYFVQKFELSLHSYIYFLRFRPNYFTPE